MRAAVRARWAAFNASRYGEGDLYLAMVCGVVIAAGVFVPFLPRLDY
ncbi:hypothetical protein [Dyella sp. ASV21]|nr:hypothetical protein [Dyella sp. ASV21]